MRKTISVSLHPDDRTRVLKAAAAKRQTISEYVRAALNKEWVENAE